MCDLTPAPTTFTAATTALLMCLLEVLLAWLLEVLLAQLTLPLLALSLLLIGCGMHAGASAIRLSAGLAAIAAHDGARLFASEPAGAFTFTGLVLNSSVAADQAMIAVAATVRHARPVAVVAVVSLIVVGAVPVVEIPVAVVIVPVSIVVVVIAVPGDVVLGDVSVVVVVDVSPTASATPVHSPCPEAPAAAEAAGYEAAAPAKGGPNRYSGAKGNTGCNGDRRRIRRHH